MFIDYYEFYGYNYNSLPTYLLLLSLILSLLLTEVPAWSSTSTKRCQSPPVVQHGRHNASAGRTSFPLGTQLVYRCVRGYSMDGPFRVICVDEGRWAGPQITCSRNCLLIYYHQRVQRGHVFGRMRQCVCLVGL